MNSENDIKDKVNEYKIRKLKDQARKQRFMERKKELGYSHISSLWLHLDALNTEILKQSLKNASQKQLLAIINFLSSNITNHSNQEKKWSRKILLENELIKYIRLKQDNRTTESLSELSIRLMKMGISTKSRITKRKIKLSTGSLSRMIRKISNEITIDP